MTMIKIIHKNYIDTKLISIPQTVVTDTYANN